MTRHEFAAAMDDAKREALRAWLDRPCPPRLEDTELWNRPPEEWFL